MNSIYHRKSGAPWLELGKGRPVAASEVENGLVGCDDADRGRRIDSTPAGQLTIAGVM